MSKTIIIAEAGVNHNGRMDYALQLVDAAVAAGADYVKFQTFKAAALLTKDAEKAAYQQANSTNASESQWQMLQKLELSPAQHEQLLRYCQEKNIKFFSTAFDLDSLQYLKDIGLDLVKIPSGEITNLPFLRRAASLFKKVILSTGMSDLEEVRHAFRIFVEGGVPREDIIILHCNTEYPTPMRDVNLKAMLQLQEAFGTEVGYSDHTLGIEVPIAAVALGARLIEKHFTLDHRLEGPDHQASLEPAALKAMVSAIRNIEQAIGGSGIKEVSPSELKNKTVARKSIVASRFIKAGEYFTEQNLTVKRPGNGLSPMLWDEVIGQRARHDFQVDELISLSV